MDLQSAVGISSKRPSQPEDGALRRLAEHLLDRSSAGSVVDRCAADRRLEAFLKNHFADLQQAAPLRLPRRNRPGFRRTGCPESCRSPAIGTLTATSM